MLLAGPDGGEPRDGSLTLAPGAVLFRGHGGDASLHAHHAVQVMVSQDEPFVLVVDDIEQRLGAAVIPSGTPHLLRGGSPGLLLLLVEPLGPRGRALDAVGRCAHGRTAGPALCSIATELGDEPDAGAVIERVVDTIAPEASAGPQGISPPVRIAMRYLEHSIAGRPTLARAADEAMISPSRLTHLFTLEVGIPFRRYRLWVRLKTAVDLVTDGASLTAAATGAGFADSAHLSRVFKSHFGLPPSALLRMSLGGWLDDAL